MDALIYARVQERLAKLKLARVAAVVDHLAEAAAQEDLPYLTFLDRLLEEEVGTRLARSVEMRTKLARFPFLKTLDQFDFSFQPALDERLVRDLASLRFLAHAENVVLLGPPGVGKTHLAIALGLAAIAEGQHVHFLSAAELTALAPEQMPQRLTSLCKPKLLIIDEMGYLPFDRPAANFLFQLVSRRYERGAIIITSNKSYGERALPCSLAHPAAGGCSLEVESFLRSTLTGDAPADEDAQASPVQGLSRRRFLAGGCLLLAAAGVGAAFIRAAATPPAMRPGAAPSGEARLVRHAMGESWVPARPQRLVVLGRGELESAAGLGFRPVGGVVPEDEQGSLPYLTFATRDAKPVGTMEQPNLTAIAAVKPDLIRPSTDR
jgi:DNA replication protein DnaC